MREREQLRRVAARRRLAAALLLCSIAVAVGTLGSASGKSLTERFDETQEQLNRATEREGVLTTRIERESETLERLEGEVAELRRREAIVAAELRRKQAELERAQRELEALRAHLRRAMAILEARLVEVYKSGRPDLLTVVLNSDGYDELIERTDYMDALQRQDTAIVERVRDLRNQMQEKVDQVKAVRDAIAERRQELRSTRASLEQRSAELAAARRAHRATLAEVSAQRKQLEGDLTDLSEKISERLGSLPPGAIRRSASGMIWPVNGPVVSGFGPRWGRIHEGIDIAVPSGTPIRAALAGNIVLAGYTGGYGNYTCIDHGGGLSTCYAHQSSYARTSGFVGQGTVIGYVGCTGSCYGDHLHFEVREGGAAVDPMGYL